MLVMMLPVVTRLMADSSSKQRPRAGKRARRDGHTLGYPQEAQTYAGTAHRDRLAAIAAELSVEADKSARKAEEGGMQEAAEAAPDKHVQYEAFT